jgi:putative transposase
MPSAPGDPAASPALTELPEPLRQRALERYHKLRPHLEQNLPLARVAEEASVPFRTAQRWVSRYRRFGLPGLVRAGRADRGKRRRLSDELCHLAEGLALQRPPLGPSAIYREVCRVADVRGQRPPGYHTVYSAIRAIPDNLKTLALDGDKRRTAKPTTCSTAVRPKARIRSGKPITPNLTYGRNAMTGSRGGHG